MGLKACWFDEDKTKDGLERQGVLSDANRSSRPAHGPQKLITRGQGGIVFYIKGL
jgi:hypothetical protein